MMSKKEHTKVWTAVLKAVAPIVDEGRFLSQEQEQVRLCYNTNISFGRSNSSSSRKASERFA